MVDVDEIVHVQDQGTGLQDTVDFADAARFAQMSHNQNHRNCVVDPPIESDKPDSFQFDVDFGANILNVSWGLAVLYQESALTNSHADQSGPGEQTVHHLVFYVQKPSSGDIALTAGATNHVYIGIDQSTNDRVVYRTNTTASPPPEPYLKLGEVDTSSNETNEMNRRPVGEYRHIYYHR